MIRITTVFAVLLILVGVIGFVGGSGVDTQTGNSNAHPVGSPVATDQAAVNSSRSVTALIPAFTGGVLLTLAVIAINPRWRTHAMHGAALIGLLGFLAAAGRGASGLARFASADDDINVRSLFFVCTMAILCGAFVVFCVASFVQARRR